MRLRIVAGSSRTEALPPAPGCVPVVDTPLCRVEATPDVPRADMGGGRTLLLLGHAVAHPAAHVARLAADHGIDTLAAHVQGRYAAVAIDQDGSCSVAGDRFGQLDLYYQRTGDATVLGTDLSLLPVSQGGDAFDQAALAHAVCVFGWRPPKKHTFYKSVRRLGVGERFHVRGGAASVVERPFEPRATAEYGDAQLDEYSDLLLGAIEARSSRRMNAVYLSSGWDSTAILGCLVRLHGKQKVRAVIGRMRYAQRSGVINQIEVDRATAIADYYGVKLDIAEFDYRSEGPELFEQLRPELLAHNICGLGALNHWLLARRVAETADGDDAVFAGEISDGAHNLGFSQFLSIFHPSLDFREYSDKMLGYLFGPSFMSRFAAGEVGDDAVYQLFRARASHGTFDAPAGDRTGRVQQLLSSFFLRGNRLPLWSLANTRLLTAEGRATYAGEMERVYLERAATEATPETLYAWYLHLYNSFHWQGSTVATIALTGDLHGLKVEMPFWDAALQDFLAAMPESWGRGLDLNPTTYPLKWMLKHRIDYPYHLQVGPHSYLYDVNPRFSLGAEVLYASAFAPYLKEALRSRAYGGIFDGSVFDLAYIDGIVDRYLAGEQMEGAELPDLILLCWLSAVGVYSA